MGDDAVRLRPASAQRGDGRAEGSDLREGALDGDLATEDVERVERDNLIRTGDPVDHDRSAVAGDRHADVPDRGGSGRLDDDVVAVAAGGGVPHLRDVRL